MTEKKTKVFECVNKCGTNATCHIAIDYYDDIEPMYPEICPYTGESKRFEEVKNEKV